MATMIVDVVSVTDSETASLSLSVSPQAGCESSRPFYVGVPSMFDSSKVKVLLTT